MIYDLGTKHISDNLLFFFLQFFSHLTCNLNSHPIKTQDLHLYTKYRSQFPPNNYDKEECNLNYLT